MSTVSDLLVINTHVSCLNVKRFDRKRAAAVSCLQTGPRTDQSVMPITSRVRLRARLRPASTCSEERSGAAVVRLGAVCPDCDAAAATVAEGMSAPTDSTHRARDLRHRLGADADQSDGVMPRSGG